MKTLFLVAALFVSFSASALELRVMEIPVVKARGTKTTRFEVNLQDGTAGISMRATRHKAPKRPSTSKTFEKLVPELSLSDNELLLSVDGLTINCGTMGLTRIFKRPVLNLSGNCDIMTKKEGNKIVVSIIAE